MDFAVGLSVPDPQHAHIEDVFFEIIENFSKILFFWNFQNFQIFPENIFGSIEKIFSEKVCKFKFLFFVNYVNIAFQQAIGHYLTPFSRGERAI